MSKAVISIKGTQTVNGDKDDVEFITEGIYTYSASEKRITYFESELTGEKGVKSVIQVFDTNVIITRSGAYKTQLILEKEKRHQCPYETPYGMMTVGIKTGAVTDSLNKSGGRLYVEYDIELNHSHASENTLEINIKLR